jgi:GNAT superfamily N-acetyltransferase
MPRLAAATDAQRRARDALTWPEWGQALSLAQWKAREVALRDHPWAKAGMESWLWLEGEQTLASCETFRNAALLGEEAGEVYSVASVFTEPALRGKGYATAMLDAVNAALEQRPRALGSVLFSDVGARIYQRSGYRAFSAREVVLPPLPGNPREGVTVVEELLPDVSSREPGVLRLTPTPDQFDWHLARERFYAQALGRSPAPFHAARVGRSYAAWMVSFKEGALRVLTIEPRKTEETTLLLQCCQRLASALGLASVRVWEPHPGFDGLPGTRTERDGELPMARLYQGRTLVDWRQVHRAVWV